MCSPFSLETGSGTGGATTKHGKRDSRNTGIGEHGGAKENRGSEAWRFDMRAEPSDRAETRQRPQQQRCIL